MTTFQVTSRRAAQVVALCATAAAAVAQIQFADLSVTGEIVLGPPRGSVATIDFNGDGYLDLAVGQGTSQVRRLYQNVPNPNNTGERTFTNVTVAAQLNDPDGLSRTSAGTVVADYDNDGDQDLFFCGYDDTTHGLLYRNDGGTFTNVSIASGVRGSGAAEAACWADYDIDGDVDLLISRFAAPFFRLLRNNGDGSFTDVSNILPPAAISAHPYCNAWSDFDGDGYPDLYSLSRNGVGSEILLRNAPDGAGGRTFVNISQSVGYRAHGPAPMGLAFGDYDGDGDLDLAISDAAIGTFYRRDPGGYAKIQPMTTQFGWGVDWFDADNDGDLDFFTAGKYPNEGFNNLQENNGDGTFTNITAALNGVLAESRYSLQVDYDNDGLQDIVALGIGERVSIYHNLTDVPNHWVKVLLEGDGCRVNRDAANALVRVTAGGRTQVREVINGSSTTSSEDPRQHFGLGAADTIEAIEVVWPRRGTLADRTEVFDGPFPADQIITLEPQARVGDANCDGVVDFFDIDAFVAALGDPNAACRFVAVDANSDGDVNFLDIDPFVTALGGACP